MFAASGPSAAMLRLLMMPPNRNKTVEGIDDAEAHRMNRGIL